MEEKKEYKITLAELLATILATNKNIAIHCDTEKKARTLLSALDKMGRTWWNGAKFNEVSHWGDYGINTVYYNVCGYADLDYAYRNNALVYEFDEVDLRDYLDPNKKYAITIDEFWAKYKENRILGIHCDTEDKAKTLLSVFDKMGKTWRILGRYTEESLWGKYGINTVYDNTRWVENLDSAYKSSVPVYEFEEVDLSKYLDNNNQHEEKGE